MMMMMIMILQLYSVSCHISINVDCSGVCAVFHEWLFDCEPGFMEAMPTEIYGKYLYIESVSFTQN